MKHRLLNMIVCVLLVFSTGLPGCKVEPPLHLYRGIDIIFPNPPEVHMDIDIMWQYSFDIEWKMEWQYGWDLIDSIIFGPTVGYEEPEEFELRRYYQAYAPQAKHTNVEAYHLEDTTFLAQYQFGYYDMLLWSSIITQSGVQSILIDESDLDNVTAETNMSMTRLPQRAAGQGQNRVSNPTYYEPEDLFAVYMQEIYISKDTADYDYYDPVRKVYYKQLEGTLQPISYIYLPQLILYNNRGRVAAVDGNAVLTGMARRTSVNTAITEGEAVNVYFNTRMKRNVTLEKGERIGEVVDIIGGRLHTFGVCNTNPNALTRAYIEDTEDHYIGLNVQFYNGKDSTLIFDVTDIVRKHYRGGVITMELDVDTLPIPYQSSGSGFDAEVVDYEEETHIIDM